MKDAPDLWQSDEPGRPPRLPRTRARRVRCGSLVFGAAALLGLSFQAAEGAEPGPVKLELTQTIRLPDHPSNEPLLGSSPYGLAWSPDGGRLAAMYGYGNDIAVWRSNGELVTNFSRHEGQGPGGDCLAFLPDGKTVLAPAPSDTEEGRKYTFGLWNADTGKLERLIPGPLHDVTGPPESSDTAEKCSLSKDGRYAAMTDRQVGEFTIYDALNWNVMDVRRVRRSDLPFRWPGESDVYIHGVTYPSTLAFGPADMLSVGLANEAILSLTPPYAGVQPTFLRGTSNWDIQPVGPDVEMLPGRNWNNEVSFRPIAYSRDGALLAIGTDTLDGYYKAFKNADLAEKRKLAHLKIWDVHAQKVVAEDPDADYVEAMDWSPDGRLLAVVTASHTRVVNAIHLNIYRPLENDGRPVLQIPFDEDAPFVLFSPDGSELAITPGNTIQIYRLTAK